MPVLAIDTELTDASVAAGAAAAAKASSQLTMIGTYAPLALLLLGAVCIVLAWIRRHPQADARCQFPTRRRRSGTARLSTIPR